MNRFSAQKVWGGIGIESMVIMGSKEEKMSGNIKTWVGHF